MKIMLTEAAGIVLRDWLGDDESPEEINLYVGDGHSGHGLYVSLRDYPEEGSEFLGTVEAH